MTQQEAKEIAAKLTKAQCDILLATDGPPVLSSAMTIDGREISVISKPGIEEGQYAFMDVQALVGRGLVGRYAQLAAGMPMDFTRYIQITPLGRVVASLLREGT